MARFWTSYEGWKLGVHYRVFSRTRVFELPMRDGNDGGWWPCLNKVFKFLNFLWGMETFTSGTQSRYIHRVFELPMRDGNGKTCTMMAIITPGFWTSYEGWKQASICWFTLNPASFWTSYEGWKPIQTIDIKISQNVFELPMRDGN